MSLHALANHMAEKGRGPDSMLIHMAPSEVHGLQALAQAHGGSLTINPETGLPEAGFLDKLLPAIIGFGITAMTGIPAWQVGLGIGAVETARTGDLGKGIAAGLGAYGGAGLGESLVTAGATQVAGDQLAQQALEQGATGTQQQIAQNIAQQNIAPANIAAAREATSTGDLLSKGFDAAKTDPMAFAKANWKPMAAAALPVLADIGETTQMPGVSQVPGKIRRYSYDPYGQSYTSAGTYEAPGAAANGGLMGMANGGMARYARGDLVQDTTFQPAINDQAAAKAAAMAPVIPVAPATTAAPAFTTQQIQDAIAASRQQGFNNDQILQGAQAKFGVDVSQYLSPAPATTATATAPFAGQGTAPATTPTRRGGMFGNVANIGMNLSPDTTAASTSSAAEPSIVRVADQGTAPAAAPKGGIFGNVANIGKDLFATPAATGLTANAANQAATGNTTAANALSNAGVTTAAAAPADQQALAVQAVQTGINAGKTPAQIAAEVNTQYGKNFTAQNVSDFAAANAPALNTAGISNAAIYAATNKDFKGAAGDTGLAGLNANIKAAMEKTATAKPNATAAEIKSILAGYGADSSDFKRAMGMTPEEWDATHGIINKPPGATVIGDGTGVLTDTGKLLPVSTLTDGTQVVVNPTQVATTGVTAPTVLNEAARTALPVGVSGNQTATINPNGTVSMNTGTPNMPAGGYTGMQSLRDAYTKGGGSLGYAPVAPKTMAEFNQRYNKLTGGSKQAYDYLMGGEYSANPYTKTGEVMKPYAESVLGIPGDVNKKRYLFDAATRSYKANPDYVPITYDSKGNKLVGISNKDVASYVSSNKDAATSDYQKWMADNNVSLEQIAGALGISLADAKKRFGTGTTAATTSTAGVAFDAAGNRVDELGRIIKGPVTIASGGLAAMADGGMSGQYDLGSYSDGGRLLRGPGDGVSDSIPATIGKGRPARLADGEFVVPARIVSEIGNGSTEAGARKLYAMMDRVQAARRNSIGRGKVAKNTRADKYLPA